MASRLRRLSRLRRPRVAAFGLLLAGSLAGCVSMPSSGQVLAYPVTQSPGGQSQQFMQFVPQSPGSTWTPSEIVQGFLTASASLGSGQRIAREYLTPEFSRQWNPKWSATVFSEGPDFRAPVVVPGKAPAVSRPAAGKSSSPAKKKPSPPETVEVLVTGKVQANLKGTASSYAVPSASAAQTRYPFYLQKVGGEWRISDAPEKLLLTSFQFSIDYQQRNLYFFDPAWHVLVPDPVYVPLQATPADLMDGLVGDLNQPPQDWLVHATQSAFQKPPGTKVGPVTLDGGVATVNLEGTAIGKDATSSAANAIQEMQQVSAQLLWTLIGSGQTTPAVQSVELIVNGKSWTPPDTQDNPLQTLDQAEYLPPAPPKNGLFYYLDSAGNLVEQNGPQGKQVTIGCVPLPRWHCASIGRGFTQIEVSPDGQYLAALRGGAQDGVLYTGPVGGKLVKRGTGFTSMSWDSNDQLWATEGDEVFMLRPTTTPGQPGAPIQVDVVSSFSTPAGPYTSIRVAPDGVRVALIVDGSVLNFGAIIWGPPGTRATAPNIRIELSPFYVTLPNTTQISDMTWYGNDNVITLSDPGPALTEYPVNGGSSTLLPVPPGIQSITASGSLPLIASVGKFGLMADQSLTGAWTSVSIGKLKVLSPVYPG